MADLGFLGRDLGATDEGSGFIYDQARRFDIAVHGATRSQLTTFTRSDIAVDGTVYYDGFRPDFTFDSSMRANR